MTKNIFLCEGQTEKKVLDALSVLGSVRFFNIWEQDVSKLVARLNGEVYVVYDTDIVSSANLKRFENNINILRKKTKLVGCLQQTENLEDELCYACDKISALKQLQSHFNAKGMDDLKSKIIQTNNLSDKLSQIEIDTGKLWIKSTLQHIKKIDIKRLYYKDLPLKK